MKNKKGYTFLTFFLIAMIIGFIGSKVIHVSSFGINITQQQYRYWRNYYACEGCIEYVFACYCSNDNEIIPDTINFYQKNDSYEIKISKKMIADSIVLEGEIIKKNNIIGLWNMVLINANNRLIIQKKNIFLK